MKSSDTWQAYDHYAYGAVATLGTLAAVALLGWVMTTDMWAALAHDMSRIVAPFLNVLGVLFGLTLAFLANDTWTAHDRARSAVLHEADAIRGLDILTEAMPSESQAALRAAIRSYVDTAMAEWPALARCDISQAASAAADELLRGFSMLATGKGGSIGASATLQKPMLDFIAKVRENRDVRIGLSRTHVNPLKWLGMAFLGFLTLTSIAVVHADAPATALIAMGLFGLASAPTATIVLIHGNPFQPPSAVSASALADALVAR